LSGDAEVEYSFPGGKIMTETSRRRASERAERVTGFHVVRCAVRGWRHRSDIEDVSIGAYEDAEEALENFPQSWGARDGYIEERDERVEDIRRARRLTGGGMHSVYHHQRRSNNNDMIAVWIFPRGPGW
jgi:hypothetical protein